MDNAGTSVTSLLVTEFGWREENIGLAGQRLNLDLIGSQTNPTAIIQPHFTSKFSLVDAIGNNGSTNSTLQILMPSAFFSLWCQGQVHWNNIELGCYRMIRRFQCEFEESIKFEDKLNFLN